MLLLFCMILCFPSPSVRAETLREKLKDIISDGDGVGAAVVVVDRSGVVWKETVGLAERSQNRMVTNSTAFPVASVSKLFIALGVHRLIEEGKFSMDSHLKILAPEIKWLNPWQDSPITVRHLLEHSSGIQEIILPFRKPDPKYFNATETVLNAAFTPESRWPPGFLNTYSNFNYIVLSFLIEKFSKMPFDAYIDQVVFKPIGMTNSSFKSKLYKANSKKVGAIAYGYRAHQEAPIPISEGHYRASAGMIASIDDLGKFLNSIINNRPEVFNQSILRSLEVPFTTESARAGLNFGHGAGGVKREIRGITLIGHNGITDGFMGSLFYNLDQKIGFGILVNSHLIPKAPSIHKIRNLIIESFLSTYRRKAASSPSRISGDFSHLAGFYYFENPRFSLLDHLAPLTDSMWVIYEGGQLYRKKVFGKRKRLFPFTSNLFRFSYEIDPHLYAGEIDGKPYLQEVPNRTYIKANPIITYSHLFCILLSAGIIVLTLPVFCYLSIVDIRKDGFSWIKLISSPQFAIFWLVLMMGCLYLMNDSQKLTGLGLLSSCFFIASTLFLPTSLIAFAASLKRIKSYGVNASSSCYLITSLACLYLALTLLQNGWFMLRMWSGIT